MSFYENAKCGVGTETDFPAAQSQDTRIASPKHTNPRAAAQAELLETMNIVCATGNAANRSRLPREEGT